MSLADQLAQGVQFAPPPDPFAQYGKMQQLQQGQQQMQISQMQLDELKRDREGMVQFQKDLAAKGGNPDLGTYADMLLKSNNSAHQKMGIELKQKLMEQQQFASIYGGGAPAAAPTAAPTAAAPTAAAPTALPAAAPENALGSGTFGMGPTAAPVNALAPTPAAPVNALTPNPAAADIEGMRRKRDALLAMGTPRALEAARSLNADLAIASRPAVFHNVPGVGLVNPLTSQVVTPSIETSPDITTMKALGYTLDDAGYRKFRDSQHFNQTSQDMLKVAQGNLALGQKRLTEETAQGNLSPETLEFAGQMVAQGGAMPSLGIGKSAAKMRQQILDRAAQISTANGATGAEGAAKVLTAKAGQAGASAGERVLGAQGANVLLASSEAKKMIRVASDYSSLVDRTQFPTMNSIENAVSRGTGGEDIVALNTALNALVNSYARAINPKGVATVSDKTHARELVNAAYTKGQLSTVFSVMDKEMTAALESTAEAKTILRKNPAGTPTAAPDIDALLNKYK